MGSAFRISWGYVASNLSSTLDMTHAVFTRVHNSHFLTKAQTPTLVGRFSIPSQQMLGTLTHGYTGENSLRTAATRGARAGPGATSRGMGPSTGRPPLTQMNSKMSGVRIGSG